MLPLPDLSRPPPWRCRTRAWGRCSRGGTNSSASFATASAHAAGGRLTAIAGRALHGLGGVGKTRLAVEYALRNKDDYNALLFVSAETPQDLRRNLSALGGPLVLDLPEKAATEEEAKVAAALNWLRGHPGWFLIVDNLDTPEAARGRRGTARPPARRRRAAHRPALGSGAAASSRWSWTCWQRDAAARFLLSAPRPVGASCPTDEPDAAELARELDGLALALEQAGAYVSHRRAEPRRLPAHWRSTSRPPGVARPAADQVPAQRRRDVGDDAAALGPGDLALLRLLSWFAPEPVPTFVLEGEKAAKVRAEAVALLGRESRRRRIAGAADLTDALAELANYSMARWDAAVQTVSVHRVLEESCGPACRRSGGRMADAGPGLLDTARPGVPWDVRNWLRWNPLRPHVAHAAALADAAGVAEPTAAADGPTRPAPDEQGSSRGCRAADAAGAGDRREELRAGTPNVATRLNNLALLQATNRLGEAEPLMRRALAIDEKSYGPDHPERRHPPQQPGVAAPRHEPASGGRAADAAGAGDPAAIYPSDWPPASSLRSRGWELSRYAEGDGHGGRRDRREV